MTTSLCHVTFCLVYDAWVLLLNPSCLFPDDTIYPLTLSRSAGPWLVDFFTAQQSLFLTDFVQIWYVGLLQWVLGHVQLWSGSVLINEVFSSTGRRPAELLGWFDARRPAVRPSSVRPLTLYIIDFYSKTTWPNLMIFYVNHLPISLFNPFSPSSCPPYPSPTAYAYGQHSSPSCLASGRAKHLPLPRRIYLCVDRYIYVIVS